MISLSRRAAMKKKPRSTLWRCTTCNGRRLVMLDTWPIVQLVRCPSCSGTQPTAQAQAAPERMAA